jgi:hypothetical protein
MTTLLLCSVGPQLGTLHHHCTGCWITHTTPCSSNMSHFCQAHRRPCSLMLRQCFAVQATTIAVLVRCRSPLRPLLQGRYSGCCWRCCTTSSCHPQLIMLARPAWRHIGGADMRRVQWPSCCCHLEHWTSHTAVTASRPVCTQATRAYCHDTTSSKREAVTAGHQHTQVCQPVTEADTRTTCGSGTVNHIDPGSSCGEQPQYGAACRLPETVSPLAPQHNRRAITNTTLTTGAHP